MATATLTLASASPRRSTRSASPTDWALLVHAVLVVRFGPRASKTRASITPG